MVSFSAEDIYEAALNAGAAAVFKKRVSPDVLVDAIRTALGAKGGLGEYDDEASPDV